jgi:hypothetical protein
MSFRLALVLFVMQAGSLHSKDGPLFTWWIAGPLDKIKPLDSAPGSLVRSVDLYAGRNEFEPFQIVLRPEGRDAAGVDIEFSDFQSDGGAQISKDNVTVYAERFVNLSQPSTIEGGAGLWPDALVPRVDRYAGERRNAFPLSVEQGHNQPVWVDVFIPESARPGRYTGLARISRNGVVDFAVPIHLRVWAFVLPSTATLKSSFGLSGTNLLKQHRGRYTNDEDLYTLTRVYAKAALLHRISVHGGSMAPPRYRYQDGQVDIGWGEYDREVGPFLDGSALSAGESLHGARATSVELRQPSSFPSEEEQALYWAAWIRHFQQKGWDDRLFRYLWDEPASGDFPKVLERGRASLRASPGLRNLVTVPYTSKLEEVVQIWVPLVNCLESKPGYDDFCAETPPLDAYTREKRQGKSLWFYQSCASHGCNVSGGRYFIGWPSYMIDASGAANRVMQWLAWKYRIAGELYYSMNEGYGADKDPWTNVRLSGGNGDGSLFYPGSPARIGGHTDIPIESIRLKLVREGMEDYEYLALLAKLAGQQAADEYADRLVKKPYLWESRQAAFLKVRWDLGETLDRLAISPRVNRRGGP